MITLFILGLVLGGAMVFFALQNTEVVTVTFFQWDITGQLAFILLSVALVGVLFTLLLTLPGSISRSFKYKKLQRENSRLEDELKKQRELNTFAQKTPPSQKEIERIEDGAIGR